MRLKASLMMLALACAAPALAAAPPPSTALSETFVSNRFTGHLPRCPGVSNCSSLGDPKTWVAPISGIYTLTLAGGEGGGFMTLNNYDPTIPFSQFIDPVPGGRGAIVSGNYRINAGTKLVIIAAQAGSMAAGALCGCAPTALIPEGGGGGGGSFVFAVSDFVTVQNGDRYGYDLSQASLLAAAGGGGGSGPSYFNPLASPGLAGRNGGNSRYMDQEGPFRGGVNGGAGESGGYTVQGEYDQFGGNGGASYREAAGGLTGGNSAAGFFTGSGTDLRDQYTRNVGTNYNLGVRAGGLNGLARGGYGGGGGGGIWPLVGINSGGGGGGYSGGAGGDLDTNGGGGGSYIADDATWLYGLDGANAGNGWVSINFLSAVPEPSSWAMVIVGFGLTGAAMRRRRGVAAA